MKTARCRKSPPLKSPPMKNSPPRKTPSTEKSPHTENSLRGILVLIAIFFTNFWGKNSIYILESFETYRDILIRGNPSERWFSQSMMQLSAFQ